MTHDPILEIPSHLRTQADLEGCWRSLMGELGFSEHLLWLMLIDCDDVPVKHLTQIEVPPEPLSADEAAELAHFLGHLVPGPDHGRWAILRSRPGRGGPVERDLAWGRVIATACREAGVPLDVHHLATDTHLVPLPYDALVVA